MNSLSNTLNIHEYDVHHLFHTSITELNNINELNFIYANTIKILYLNARSLYNKVDELQCILKLIKAKIMIIAISETWMSEADLKYFNFAGYKSEFACRPNRSGGCSAILIHEQLEHRIQVQRYS